MAKSPVLAGVLNFVLAGVGYIYVGRRVASGVLLMLGELLLVVGFVGGHVEIPPMATLGGLLINLALGLDGWKDAREFNDMQPRTTIYEGEIVD